MTSEKDLTVYVPSRSRHAVKSLTLERIEGGWPKNKIFLVVPTEQAKLYERNMPERNGVAVLACPAKGIAATRQWIGKNSETEKFIMLDDDLRFFYRPLVRPIDDPLGGGGEPNEPPRMYRAMPKHINEMFHEVSQRLNSYAHVAVGPREGNNRAPYPGWECKRPLRALAYRREPFLSVEHGRVAIMEDFDVTLQLLRKGYKNWVTTCFAQDQYATQLPGGCGDYRTHELHEKNVRKLASLHSPFVTTRWKNNKHGGEFGKRLEATIYWVAAYESSLRELGL